MQNRRSVAFGGESFDVEASIRAESVYASEFAGSLPKPYHGLLEDDMLIVYRLTQQTVESRVKADRKGNPVIGKDGEYIPVTRGGVMAQVPNPEYRGVDAEALLRLTWAMGVAAGSITEPWGKHTTAVDGEMVECEGWGERMAHASTSVHEIAALFAAIVYELGGGCIFRDPTRHGNAVDADAGQSGAVEPTD